MNPGTIGSINLLEENKKSSIYSRIIPQELLDRFNIPESFKDQEGRPLLTFKFGAGKSDVEMKLFHQFGFPDPILYGHLTDTISGQIHILLYVLNDPDAERFDVDRMPDGSPTKFGIVKRNIAAEAAALNAGLAPGQIRSGLRLLPAAINQFESFIESLGHTMYFAEPLYYHVAVLFERYGFAYQKGRQKMERIEKGFQNNGELFKKMDNSSPFRNSEGVNSIRMRSWAIHDGILGESFNEVTMYKNIGKSAGVVTCPECDW
ncbi:MAG: hypothetical protein ACK2TS_04835 [Anaerolineales bacterium]